MSTTVLSKRSNSTKNKIDEEDKRIHDWYRFVLSYPPHLVSEYLEKFNLNDKSTVLDPFCGTGTTLVEAKLKNVNSIGIEASPFAHFVSQVKLDWDFNLNEFEDCINKIEKATLKKMSSQNIKDDVKNNLEDITGKLRTVNTDKQKLLIKNSISEIPLHKSLMLLDEIKRYKRTDFFDHLMLAFASSAVFGFSNLRFGPEVGVGKIKVDSPVIGLWKAKSLEMVNDIRNLDKIYTASSDVYNSDSRFEISEIRNETIDAVITSPPYPNEKDYSRTTRLESVLLDYMVDRKGLQKVKKSFIRSNTRGVYVKDNDAEFVEKFSSISKIADQIEKRRIELGKTSGFEKLYSRVTKLYFGGMYRHLSSMKPKLRSGAKLAYVVGDQASYLRIKIRTGELLAEIADDLGYNVCSLDLFRTRFATATEDDLREEVLILEKK